MSLLFALFVLINSFSEVDAESFKRNAGPMSEAFNGNVKETDITYTGKKKKKEKREKKREKERKKKKKWRNKNEPQITIVNN
jgi:hypothetical protein